MALKICFCFSLFVALSFGQTWQKCGFYEYFYNETEFNEVGYNGVKESCQKLDTSLVLIKSE